MPSAKVSSKHQITLPGKARRALGVEPGDRLSVGVVGDALILRRLPARSSERLRGLSRECWRGVDAVGHVPSLREQGDVRLP
jgi:AbrB family looped-hinge helix DNA binding protein